MTIDPHRLRESISGMGYRMHRLVLAHAPNHILCNEVYLAAMRAVALKTGQNAAEWEGEVKEVMDGLEKLLFTRHT